MPTSEGPGSCDTPKRRPQRSDGRHESSVLASKGKSDRLTSAMILTRKSADADALPLAAVGDGNRDENKQALFA